MHCFRLRLDMHGFMRISSHDQQHVLDQSETGRVTLEVVEADPLQGEQAASVVVIGSGYESEDAAGEAGAEWTAVVQRAFATQNIGADTGARRLGGDWAVRDSPSGAVEPRILFDEPGLTVYEQEEGGDPPLFARRSSSGWAGRGPQTLVDAIQDVRANNTPLSPLEQTAYELYSSSFSATSTDARFVVLMMALETLIEPQPRGADVVSHVDELMKLTREAGLPPDEAASVLSTLNYLREESIGQAGRRLARRLEGRHFKELEPDKFFTKCYGLRSALVHGGHPRPSGDEIEQYTPHLERLVSDLLAAGPPAQERVAARA